MSTIACAVALAACGGSKQDEGLIPSDQGEQISALLDQLEQRVDDGICEAAAATALEIVNRVEALPSEVDNDLEQTLVEASGNLVTLVRDDCEPAEEKEPPADDEPTTGATGEEGAAP